MKPDLQTAWPAAALLISLGFATGCATPALWNKQEYRPAAEPHLLLAASPRQKDVLVRYDEQWGEPAKTRRRAYWLFQHSANATVRTKPRFVEPSTLTDLQAIPLESTDTAGAVAKEGWRAVRTCEASRFNLWRGDRCLGCFKLPVYRAPPLAVGWRLALTPFAVAADVAAGGAAIIAFGNGGAAGAGP